MRRREALAGLCGAFAAAALAACRERSGSAQGDGKPSGSGEPSESGARAGGARRIVVAGGALAEIAYELGAGAEVVGADTSCTFPEAVRKLPQVGYQRKLSAEGVLSLRPTLLLASSEAGPPEALSQIEGAGVRVVRFDPVMSLDAATARILKVGEALGRKKEAQDLAERVVMEVAQARSEVKGRTERPRALFVFSRGPGLAMVAGRGTPAAAMIDLAGGVNAAEALDGFQSISAEAVIAARPDVVIVSDKALESLGGEAGLFALPGLAATPAGRGKRVAAIDDSLLLGFGPRLGLGLRTLAGGLHGAAGAVR